MTSTRSDATPGPVIFAYDGTELAGIAIEQAAAQLALPREAVVVCVSQPADVGFAPITKRHFDAHQANEVQQVAEETAAYGSSLAQKVGFPARIATVERAPTWRG